MDVKMMREAVCKAPKYNKSESALITWRSKVSMMKDNQVIAIYYRMLREGEL